MIKMNSLGYANDFLEPYESFSNELISNCRNGQIIFQTELNNYFNVNSFSDRVFHVIYDGLKNCLNDQQKKTIINSSYDLIVSSELFDPIQKDYFKRALTISYYLIGSGIGEVTAAWYDCLGFVASAVGAAISGPFGAGLGIIGMATSAPGCEETLGW